MGLLDKLFGGGRGAGGHHAIGELQRQYGQAQQQLAPYQQAGQQGLQGYQDYLQQFSLPCDRCCPHRYQPPYRQRRA